MVLIGYQGARGMSRPGDCPHRPEYAEEWKGSGGNASVGGRMPLELRISWKIGRCGEECLREAKWATLGIRVSKQPKGQNDFP